MHRYVKAGVTLPLIKNVVKAVLPPRLILYKGRSKRHEICLTFDDGPHPLNTPKVLDVLKEKGIKGTFFLQGHLVDVHGDIVSKMVADGHQLANHGYYHKSCDELNLQDYVVNVARTENVLTKYDDKGKKKLFRPPYGSLNGRYFLSLIARGYRFVMWTIDSQDSFLSNKEDLVSYIKTIELSSGDILLFHDDYAHTVDSLPAIIDCLHSRGFSMVSIDEMLAN